MKLSAEQRAVLMRRSSLNKIGVPIERKRVPPGLLVGVDQCLRDGLLIWIDRAIVPHTGVPDVLDIYVVTPKGLAALKELS